mmetsp:Transcript_13883/g.27742  ORF Transcript_13883/g.27742 Transcript_13883/m.27742 type:complete len:227 (-) Transcript_13883:2270-2950(-)
MVLVLNFTSSIVIVTYGSHLPIISILGKLFTALIVTSIELSPPALSEICPKSIPLSREDAPATNEVFKKTVPQQGVFFLSPRNPCNPQDNSFGVDVTGTVNFPIVLLFPSLSSSNISQTNSSPVVQSNSNVASQEGSRVFHLVSVLFCCPPIVILRNGSALCDMVSIFGRPFAPVTSTLNTPGTFSCPSSSWPSSASSSSTSPLLDRVITTCAGWPSLPLTGTPPL